MHTRIWPGSETLGRARRLEEMGLALAHQFKNPLCAMKALVQLGLRNPAESPSHRRLAAVEAEVERMLGILGSRFAAGRPEALVVSAGAGSGQAASAGDLRRTG